jgi:prepilin-type N-terminal cleavage/methylation domain-containing protein
MTGERGFTLIETILVSALIAIIAATAFIVAPTMASQVRLGLAADTVALALQQARAYSVAMVNDSNWGVHVLADSVVVFKGSDYGGRDTTLDSTFELPVSVNISPDDEMIFQKGSGLPLRDYTALLGYHNFESSVTVSVNGLINVQR